MGSFGNMMTSHTKFRIRPILPVHHAQLLTYLRLSRMRFGLLVNFNVARLRNGVKRAVLDPH